MHSVCIMLMASSCYHIHRPLLFLLHNVFFLLIIMHSGSTTGRFLHRTGLIELYEEVNSQLDRKLPILLKEIDKQMKPLLEKTHHFYTIAIDFFYTLVEPLIIWSDEVLYPFINSLVKAWYQWFGFIMTTFKWIVEFIFYFWTKGYMNRSENSRKIESRFLSSSFHQSMYIVRYLMFIKQ